MDPHTSLEVTAEHESSLDETGADENTCAICLEQIEPEKLAIVKDCGHCYCGTCILRWASQREDANRCPQCKSPFDFLFVHRKLDGSLSDYPVEESVVLLKRSVWFQTYIKEVEQGKIVVSEHSALNSITGRLAELDFDWQDYAAAEIDAEYEDDEEMEAYYFSSAAGKARVVLGNRRWGENGYVASGRQQARPVPAKGKDKAKASGASSSGASSSAGASGARPKADGAATETPKGKPGRASGKGKAPMAPAAASSTSSKEKGGRRALRNLRRAAADERDFDF